MQVNIAKKGTREMNTNELAGQQNQGNAIGGALSAVAPLALMMADGGEISNGANQSAFSNSGAQSKFGQFLSNGMASSGDAMTKGNTSGQNVNRYI